MSWYIDESSTVYLDYNATTPLAKEVQESIIKGLDLWANPSSNNHLAEEVRKSIEDARKSVADLFHVTSKEVTFTSGGTEANTWVIQSAIDQFTASYPGEVPHIISSTIDHPSIIEPLKHLKEKGTIDLTLVPVDPTTGQVLLSELDTSIRRETCLVTIMLANNETGVLQPIAEIADSVRRAGNTFDHRIFMHTDVAQAVGKIDVDLNKLKVDAVTVVGHKFYGPRIGALVIRSSNTVSLRPFLFGGGQENGLRAGTENTPMILGLGMAAQISNDKLSEITTQLTEIRDYFEQQLKAKLGDAAVHIHFGSSPRLPNTSSVAFPNYSSHSCDLLEKCKSFIASTGAACHSGLVSPVLTACGISHDLASKTVRFSFGRETTKEQVDRVVNEVKAMMFFAKFGSSLMGVLNKGPVCPF